MSTPILSIVIPAFNVESYVAAAVRSALAQTFDDIEVIVVDDGSTDSTAVRVSAFEDPRLRLLRQTNKGLAGARNTGIRAARGEFVGFLDGDDMWVPERADRHLQLMRNEPGVGVSFSHYAYIDEAGNPTGHQMVSRTREPSLRQMTRRNRVGSSVIARKDCLLSAGLFDEGLRSSEDYELWIRVLALTPYRLRLIPEPLALYRLRPDSLTMDFDGFLKTADAVSEKLRERFPQLPASDIRRGRSEHYRIASRKALAAGRFDLARTHLWQALRIYPALPVVDLRAFATLVIVATGTLVPSSFSSLPYSSVVRTIRLCRRLRSRTS